MRLLTAGKCVGGEEPCYASISIASPDLNSTVKWSAKTVICWISFRTRLFVEFGDVGSLISGEALQLVDALPGFLAAAGVCFGL